MSTIVEKNSVEKNEEQNFAGCLDNRIAVADTSALLQAGTRLLEDLPECEIVIPHIVISELEAKRSDMRTGFLAREWLRLFEELRSSAGKSLRKGVQLESHPHVMLRMEPNHKSQESLPSHLKDGSNDSTILAVAKNLTDEMRAENTAGSEEENSVVVLSNDIPMRLHATLDLELEATGYNASAVEKIVPWSGYHVVALTEDEVEDIYSSRGSQAGVKNLSAEVTDEIMDEVPASWALVEIVLATTGSHVLYVLKTPYGLQDVDNGCEASQVSGRTVQQNVALKYLTEDVSSLPIVSLGGSAGTGKTLLALAAGIEGVMSDRYSKVMVFRSLHEMGEGQEMGFLPGDSDDKMRPWGGAIFDALEALKNEHNKTPHRKGKNVMHTTESRNADDYKEMVEISPITYLRGRSLNEKYIVIEEAQNFSERELLNILSRVGENSKVVFTFDSAQVDNKFLQSGENADVWSVVNKLKDKNLFSHITLVKTERSQVAQIASEALIS